MKKLIYLSFAFFLLSCGAETKEENTSPEEKTSSEKETSEQTDKADITTKTVKIGEIEFAEQNLDVTTYRNGDPVPQAKTAEEWKAYAEKKEGCYAFPGFKAENIKNYGLIYSGYCVSDKRGLAPEGWKVPDSKTWNKAIEALGGKEVAGKKVKSTNGWKVNGDNSSGFNALPGGFFAGEFGFMGERVYFWSASVTDTEYHDHFDLSGDNDEFAPWYDHDSWGLYVRCVKE